jgi:hypothetical protein
MVLRTTSASAVIPLLLEELYSKSQIFMTFSDPVYDPLTEKMS